ncbi:hypothetical protein ABZ318_15660 [Streptomyces sp. NPDC006197]|uniref:hypothetical protein n=1 Tax=Streptomyces sp. NPDC006197 TaxID=3156685 RepID=UPI0033A488B9
MTKPTAPSAASAKPGQPSTTTTRSLPTTASTSQPPRIWDADADADQAGDAETVASMDDETLFGPVAYRLTLSDAIDLGLLADY